MASPFLIWMRKQPLRSVSNPTDSWAVLCSRFAAKVRHLPLGMVSLILSWRRRVDQMQHSIRRGEQPSWPIHALLTGWDASWCTSQLRKLSNLQLH